MHVVVTTKHRGVFFGEIDPEHRGREHIEMKGGRMCVYWSQDVKGVPGLAATGPTAGCRVSKAPETSILRDVTAVFECSPAAVKAWESEPWSS